MVDAHDGASPVSEGAMVCGRRWAGGLSDDIPRPITTTQARSATGSPTEGPLRSPVPIARQGLSGACAGFATCSAVQCSSLACTAPKQLASQPQLSGIPRPRPRSFHQSPLAGLPRAAQPPPALIAKTDLASCRTLPTHHATRCA
jgi:hypothetical protein